MIRKSGIFRAIFAVLIFLNLIFGCAIGISKNYDFKHSENFDNENKNENIAKNKLQTISIASWNVQTFFDAVNDGCEYSDFKNSSKWTKEMYIRRLEKLCEVMKLLNCDIIVLEEIENEAVVLDISNRLTESSWSKKKGWRYACFTKEPKSAIGCAVFSRLEISSLTAHSMDIQIHKQKQPASRPLMQLTLKAGEKEVLLFVNHWKSKSGGQEKTEIWRDWQEAILAQCIAKTVVVNNACPVIICGDFNRSAEDFISLNQDFSASLCESFDFFNKYKANLILRRFCENPVCVYSAWFCDDGSFATKIGSYYYQNSWERIDNFFFAGNVTVNQFEVVSEPPLAGQNLIPQGYKVFTDSGCSDHLPIKCIVSF